MRPRPILYDIKPLVMSIRLRYTFSSALLSYWSLYRIHVLNYNQLRAQLSNQRPAVLKGAAASQNGGPEKLFSSLNFVLSADPLKISTTSLV